MIRQPMTADQATALAAFLVTLRPGQRDWNKASIFDALAEAGAKFSADAEALARAAIRAALTPSIRKPSVIAMTGEHWEAITEAADREPERTRLCTMCGNWHRPSETCQPPTDRMSLTRTADYIAAARLAVNGKKPGCRDRAAEAARAVTDTELPKETT